MSDTIDALRERYTIPTDQMRTAYGAPLDVDAMLAELARMQAENAMVKAERDSFLVIYEGALENALNWYETATVRGDTYRRRALALVAMCRTLRRCIVRVATSSERTQRLWVDRDEERKKRKAAEAELSTLRESLAASQERERRMRSVIEDAFEYRPEHDWSCMKYRWGGKHQCNCGFEDFVKRAREATSALALPAPSGDGDGK